ncbi:hypothetical protein [Thalassobius sp. Cn5-15]|nr:hypothetical protein [Thalassobius sp. Cn5-15]
MANMNYFFVSISSASFTAAAMQPDGLSAAALIGIFSAIAAFIYEMNT